MYRDVILGIIRTTVPAIVGAGVTYLGRTTGVVIPEDLSVGATVATVTALTVGYYAMVRALEAKWPPAGWLLGAARAPQYPEQTPDLSR